MLTILISVAVLGAVGSVARYLVSEYTSRLSDGFPWGTLIVNVVGCFVFGLVWTLFDRHSSWEPQWRFAILAGFAGAFTTYSTFAFDTYQLLEKSSYLLAFANVACQTFCGLGMIFFGVVMGRFLST